MPHPFDEPGATPGASPSAVEGMAARGIILASPADAARAFPSLFPTIEAAKKSFQRAGLSGREVGDNPQWASLLRRMSPTSPMRFSYRPQGAGQRMQTGWARPNTDPAELQRWLQGHLGELAVFTPDGPPASPPMPPDWPRPGRPLESVGADPAPAPTAPAQGGARAAPEDTAGPKGGPHPPEAATAAPAPPEPEPVTEPASNGDEKRDMAPEPEPVRVPPGAVGGSGGCDAPSEGAEAPPGPSVAPPGPIALGPAAEGPPADEQAVLRLQERLRLNALAQRLHEARPRRVWGVRALDWEAWQVAAQAAAELPTAAWKVWRRMVGTAVPAWTPSSTASVPTVDAHR